MIIQGWLSGGIGFVFPLDFSFRCSALHPRRVGFGLDIPWLTRHLHNPGTSGLDEIDVEIALRKLGEYNHDILKAQRVPI